MVRAENKPMSRSVEHLVPNNVLRVPRTKNDGDFFACRKCNARKSHMDYVLGTLAKSQSRDDEFAANALIDAVTDKERRAERFIEMLRGSVNTVSGVEFEIPVFGTELLEYLQFLGKGQYFKVTQQVFRPVTQVMLLDYVNKEVLSNLESSYEVHHGTNPFRDLTLNKYAEVLSGGDCIIYSKNRSFLFLLHDYTAIIIVVKPRNKKNSEREREKNDYIRRNFAVKPTRSTAATATSSST